MQRAPLLSPAAAFLLAIVLQSHGSSLSGVCIGIALACIRTEIGVGCFAGIIIGVLCGHPAIIEHEQPTSHYRGTVVGDVRTEDGIATFAFSVNDIGTLRASGRVHVRAGERLTVRARITPIDEARNPGEPSLREIALDNGVIGELSIIAVLHHAPPDLHDARVWMPIVRERASEQIRMLLPEPEATVLAGALWGERGTLPQDVRDDFQATGTVHVLVTAGLHLGVIAAIAGACFTLLRVPRIAAALSTLPIVYAYAWLSGWHLPSQRAAAMISIALLARACGARAFTLNTLAIAAIVVAACWPVAVESVSFALSFSCVTAIVLFAQPIAQRLRALRVPEAVAEALALTLSTQIGVWPLTAAVFFTVAPYAIIANAIVVPIVCATMALGIATLLCHPFVALSAIFARWDTWLLAFVLAATHAIASLPGARLTMTPPPLWAIVGYDLAAIGAALALRKRPVFAMCTLIGASCGVAFVATIPHGGGFSITALDVGQGDGFIVRTPHGRTIVIDTGGRLERGAIVDGRSPAERSGERVFVPYLRRAGITSVDLLVLTHPHGDHVGASSAILDMMPVGWIADSGQSYGGHAYNDALASARNHHIAIIVPKCRQHWIDDEVTLTFLSPCGKPFTDGANDVNENSLVILVQYRTFRALFMGDAGFQSEARLLSLGVDLHADMLKVGHHGSAYSSSAAFIDAVRPRIAIISVGRHNLFGHPAPVTLLTLKAAGASIFRTDACGAIIVTIRGTDALTTDTILTCALAGPRRLDFQRHDVGRSAPSYLQHT